LLDKISSFYIVQEEIPLLYTSNDNVLKESGYVESSCSCENTSQQLSNVLSGRFIIQLDIGFGDIVIPSPEPTNYPTLLDLSAPRLRGYSRESTIAEKFEAMIKLGILNSLMKDFFDI